MDYPLEFLGKRSGRNGIFCQKYRQTQAKPNIKAQANPASALTAQPQLLLKAPLLSQISWDTGNNHYQGSTWRSPELFLTFWLVSRPTLHFGARAPFELHRPARELLFLT